MDKKQFILDVISQGEIKHFHHIKTTGDVTIFVSVKDGNSFDVECSVIDGRYSHGVITYYGDLRYSESLHPTLWFFIRDSLKNMKNIEI